MLYACKATGINGALETHLIVLFFFPFGKSMYLTLFIHVFFRPYFWSHCFSMPIGTDISFIFSKIKLMMLWMT